jgi:WD40 repeat protein
MSLVVVAGGADGALRVWSVPAGGGGDDEGAGVPAPALTPAALARGHSAACLCVAAEPSEGGLVASGGADDEVRLWRWGGAGLAALGALGRHEGSVRALAFGCGPSAGLLASAGEDGRVLLWRFGALLAGVPAALAPDARPALAPGSAPQGTPQGVASPQGMASPQALVSPQPAAGQRPAPMLCVAFAGDAARVCASGEDLIMRLWSVPDGALLASWGVGDSAVFGGCALLGGGGVLTAHRDGWLRVWSEDGPGALAGKARASRQLLESLAVAPAGAALAATGADDGAVCLWRTPSLERVARLTGHTKWVLGVAFPPSHSWAHGRLLASASHDGTVRIWPLPATSAQDARVLSAGSPLNCVALL